MAKVSTTTPSKVTPSKVASGKVTPGKVKSAPRAAAGKQQAATAIAKTKAAVGTVAVKPGVPKKAPAASKAPAKTALAATTTGKLKGPAANAQAAAATTSPAKAGSLVAKARTPAGNKPPPNQPALKPPTKPTVAPRAAVTAKTGGKTAVKAAAVRRPANRTAVPTLSPRRTRSIAAPRKVRTPPRELPAPARQAPAASTSSLADHNALQSFTVSHLDQKDFKPDGLRAYAQYRDLGIAAATGGLCQAHVIRFNPPCTDEVRQPHAHDVELQLIYVLQGWMKNDFDGHGTQMMSTGSCWLQPRGIRHTVLDYSPDCEVLEVIVPADFKTRQI